MILSRIGGSLVSWEEVVHIMLMTGCNVHLQQVSAYYTVGACSHPNLLQALTADYKKVIMFMYLYKDNCQKSIFRVACMDHWCCISSRAHCYIT